MAKRSGRTLSELDFYRGKPWKKCEKLVQERATLLALEDDVYSRMVAKTLVKSGPESAVACIAARLFFLDNDWKISAEEAVRIYESIRFSWSKQDHSRLSELRSMLAWSAVPRSIFEKRRKEWPIKLFSGAGVKKKDGLAAVLLYNVLFGIEPNDLTTSEVMAIHGIRQFLCPEKEPA